MFSDVNFFPHFRISSCSHCRCIEELLVLSCTCVEDVTNQPNTTQRFIFRTSILSFDAVSFCHVFVPIELVWTPGILRPSKVQHLFMPLIHHLFAWKRLNVFWKTMAPLYLWMVFLCFFHGSSNLFPPKTWWTSAGELSAWSTCDLRQCRQYEFHGHSYPWRTPADPSLESRDHKQLGGFSRSFCW